MRKRIYSLKYFDKLHIFTNFAHEIHKYMHFTPSFLHFYAKDHDKMHDNHK